MQMELDADELKEKEKKRKKRYLLLVAPALAFNADGCVVDADAMVVSNRSKSVVDADRWWWATGMMDADGNECGVTQHVTCT